MGRPVIVAVQKQQPLALGGLDAGIARGGQPAVRAVDDRNAGAKLSKSITHGGAGIRGAIVHQDALQSAGPACSTTLLTQAER